MDTETLAKYLHSMKRTMSEQEVHTAERERDAERGTLYRTGQHAEYGASQH